MCILGVDPGSNVTGYGFIEKKRGQSSLVETGTIQPSRRDPLQIRIQKVYNHLDALVIQRRPAVMVLEKIYAHHEFPTTVGVLGHVRGVICLLAAQRNVPLVEYSVKRIRKCITGNGNASKIQTRRVVSYLLNIDEGQLTLDASDALALALAHAQMQENPLSALL